jgi:hypothetical protein
MSAGGIIADTMANLKTVKDASGKEYTYKLAVRTPEQKKKYVAKKLAEKKKMNLKKFKDFLKSLREFPYHSYEDDRGEEVMYSAGEIIETLKMIHRGEQLEDLGFSDPEEAKAFYRDWYLLHWLGMENGDDRSKIKLS